MVPQVFGARVKTLYLSCLKPLSGYFLSFSTGCRYSYAKRLRGTTGICHTGVDEVIGQSLAWMFGSKPAKLFRIRGCVYNYISAKPEYASQPSRHLHSTILCMDNGGMYCTYPLVAFNFSRQGYHPRHRGITCLNACAGNAPLSIQDVLKHVNVIAPDQSAWKEGVEEKRASPAAAVSTAVSSPTESTSTIDEYFRVKQNLTSGCG